MNQETANAYIDKMSAQLKEVGAQVEIVKAQIAKGAAHLRSDYHTQIEDWHKRETNFKAELEKLRSSGAETFETVKHNAQSMWTELSHFVSENFSSNSEFTKGNTL